MTGHEDGRLPDVEIERILSAGFAPHVPKSIGGSSIRWADRFPGTATAPQDGELPGSEGRYRVGCEIGRGGIGIVYEGQDRDLLREVALKVLRPDRAASADLERRFLREARIECFLDHPGVVPVYDMGEAARRVPFFAMKLVRGRPLSALLAERDSPGVNLPGLLRVFEQVCLAMAHAHERGVVHRDLKPANVMVGGFGEVHVVDWGFAGIRGLPERPSPAGPPGPGEADGLSTPGTVMGTPAYMPPEQARAEMETTDERSDVFALGAVLVEILTGDPPYIGDRNRVSSLAARAELTECFARLGTCGAPAELVSLARGCLAAQKEDRPQHAGEVADAVGKYLAAAEERARQAEIEAAAERVRREAEQHRERMTRQREVLHRAAHRRAQVVAGAVLLALLAGGALLFARRAAESRRAGEGAAEVAAALSEASGFEGAGDWDAAQASARRAVAAADAKGATREIRVRAEAELARIAAAAAAARERESRRVRDAAALTQVYRTQREGEGYGTEEMDLRITAVLRECDLDPRTMSAGEIADRVRDSDRSAEMASALEWWGAVRWSRNFDEEARTLFTAARLASPDPFRERLVEAHLARDIRTIADLAAEADAGSLSTATIWMLCDTRTIPEKTLVPLLLRVWARQAADPLVVFQLALRKDFHRSSRFAVARLALDPGLPVAWAACASALQKTGDLDLAERLCRRSLSMADPSPFEHRVLFEILNGRGRKEEAAEAFRRGVQAYEEDLREHPANAERIIQFARFHRDCGRMEDAVSVLTRGIEAAPDQAVLRYELAGRLTELGRPAEALPLAEEALARMPERYRARNLLRVAAALRALGRRDAATEHWREVLLLEPHNAEVHVALAGDEFQLGDFAAAEVRLRAVVEREPEYVRARDNLIYYTALAGDPDAALRMANEWMAEGLFPRRVLVSLGIAHVRAGRFEEAIRPIEETCKAMGVRDRFLGLALVAVWGRSDPERAGNARALYDRIVETPAVDSLEYRVLRGLAEEALGIAGAK